MQGAQLRPRVNPCADGASNHNDNRGHGCRGSDNHASLLPALRGAAPIQAAIRLGHTVSGVTVMRVVQALDAGPMILQAEAPILEDETYGELQVRLSELGALTLVEALTLISLGKAKEIPQDESRATYAPKVNRESSRIDWSQSAIEISRLIRSCDPKPGAFTTTPRGEVKTFGPKVMDGIKGRPGEVLKTTGELIVACGLDANVYDPMARLAVTANGFAAVAERLLAWADELCEGRLVLVQEGGVVNGRVIMSAPAATEGGRRSKVRLSPELAER